MEELLITFVTIHPYLVYLVIVVLCFFAGPVISMIGGLLISLGYFSFVPLYITLILADLIGDTIWYYIGYKSGYAFIRRFGKYFGITEAAVEKTKLLFHKHKHPILLISKLTNGFGFAIITLMTAGMVKIPFGKYIAINLVGQFVWSGLLLGVGYFFASAYVQVDSVLSRMSVIALFAIFILAFFGYRNYMRSRAESDGNINS